MRILREKHEPGFLKQRMDFILADTACFQLRKHAFKNMRKARYVIKRTDRFELLKLLFPQSE